VDLPGTADTTYLLQGAGPFNIPAIINLGAGTTTCYIGDGPDTVIRLTGGYSFNGAFTLADGATSLGLQNLTVDGQGLYGRAVALGRDAGLYGDGVTFKNCISSPFAGAAVFGDARTVVRLVRVSAAVGRARPARHVWAARKGATHLDARTPAQSLPTPPVRRSVPWPTASTSQAAFSNNTAGAGGAIKTFGAELTIENVSCCSAAVLRCWLPGVRCLLAGSAALCVFGYRWLCACVSACPTLCQWPSALAAKQRHSVYCPPNVSAVGVHRQRGHQRRRRGAAGNLCWRKRSCGDDDKREWGRARAAAKRCRSCHCSRIGAPLTRRHGRLPLLRNQTRFNGNTAGASGGAVHLTGQGGLTPMTVTIRRCSFAANAAASQGGALYTQQRVALTIDQASVPSGGLCWSCGQCACLCLVPLQARADSMPKGPCAARLL
jgi:predicted outer membrane repeat protein